MAGKLTGQRKGNFHFTVSNDRGATVEIGKGAGQFSPGELLQLAVAGCAALSADHRLGRRLGDEYEATFTVTAEHDDANNRFTSFDTRFFLNLDHMDGEELRSLRSVVDRAIERWCTVGRTLDEPAAHTVSIHNASEADAGE